jgi:ribosomal protein L23
LGKIKKKSATPASGKYALVLRSPRITEKASAHMERGAYVFIVDPRVTKRGVALAVKEIYGVTPKKVRMATIPQKVIFSGRRLRGVKAGGKKAYVYLKSGETITVI